MKIRDRLYYSYMLLHIYPFKDLFKEIFKKIAILIKQLFFSFLTNHYTQQIIILLFVFYHHLGVSWRLL